MSDDKIGLKVPIMSRVVLTLSLLLISSTLLIASFGCAPSSPGGGQNPPPSSQDLPELTKEIIDERINEARVYDVLPESGTGDPIPWGFDEDEPKEMTIVEKQVDGTRATIVLDIKTSSSPRSRVQRHLAGQIRTMWELRTGWVLRRWEIVNTENISMKYRDLPPLPPPSPGAPIR
jgi:hypothetical protein